MFHKKKKQTREIPSRPCWDEIISIMYNKQLNGFDAKVIEVLYSSDKTRRFVLLKDNNGVFRYCFEELHPFSEEEWMYVSRSGAILPAIWETPSSWQGTSLYATLEDMRKELELSPEYKLYFKQEVSDD